MNLDRCTPPQREVVTTLDAPLMVEAGAGSGKTFTLTQRIACALLPDDQGVRHLSSVREVCAITFTDKAAAELRDRVKKLLVSEGMVEEALAVDGAWISTIHSMAGRILRENAFELGLDPSFGILAESQVAELRNQATDQVLSEVRHGGDALVAAMFDDVASDFEGNALVDWALRVVRRAKAVPGGFEALVLPERPCAPQALLREVRDAGRAVYEAACAWGEPGDTEQGVLDALEAAIEGADAYLDEAGDDDNAFADDGGYDAGGGFDPDAFRAVFYAFPPTSAGFHARKDGADLFSRYRSEYARLADEVEAGFMWRRMCGVVRLAKAIDARLSDLKGPARLDNDDLLARCYEALRDHPDMAARYRDRFKLIMIDEFQDTDRLQVALVSLLAQPQLSNMCTVGDAQQSIYRFRGADVDIFRSYRDELRSRNEAAHMVALPDNFRSHADVLALVDDVFGQPGAFGDEFLHLEPRAALNGEHDPLFDENPRLVLDIVHCSNATKTRVNIDVGREFAARRIAERFAKLHEDGAQPGDMVLLLGGMTHADVYADALREAGLESIVTGGSVFAASEEAQLVGDLLRYAVDDADEPALFAVLTSMLFALPDDVLLALASRPGDGGDVRPRSLAQGFADVEGVADAALSGELQQALSLARTALAHFARTAHGGHVAEALRALFVETGLLDRLEAMGADGLACAGNVGKALSIVESLEREVAGISSLSRAYDEHLACEKEPPGTLATLQSDFVHIMTVHASKGLEFPHVAVAEVRNGKACREQFYAENIGDATYVAMSTPVAGEQAKTIGKLRNFERLDEDLRPDQVEMPGEVHAALCAHVGERELAEARRLLYVAMTRASRSLMLSICTKSKSADLYESDGIYRDVYTALRWDVSADRSQQMIACSAGAPVQVRFAHLKKDAADDEVEPGAADDEAASVDAADADAGGDADGAPAAADGGESPAGEFTIAQRPPVEPIASVASDGRGLREDVFSYTSLSDAAGWDDDVRRPSDDAGDDASFDDGLERDSDDVATDLGTAFHLLSQRAVIRRDAQTGADPSRGLVPPDEQEIRACVRAHGLSEAQEERLAAACGRWFSSALARRMAASGELEAEVPFLVAIDVSGAAPGEAPDARFYLEGAIDLLATDGDGTATVVDYKTGGSADEEPEDLHAKHLLQAQCYALALLIAGYERVEAHFTRVEHADPDDPAEPQTVDYLFTRDDLDALRADVCAAWRRAQEHAGDDAARGSDDHDAGERI